MNLVVSDAPCCLTYIVYHVNSISEVLFGGHMKGMESPQDSAVHQYLHTSTSTLHHRTIASHGEPIHVVHDHILDTPTEPPEMHHEHPPKHHIANALDHIDLMHTRIRDGSLFENADKWGTSEQRARWIVNILLSGIALVTLGIVKSVLHIALKSYVFMIFIYYGIVLWVLRSIILWFVVKLAKESDLLATIANAFIGFMNVEYNALFDTVNLFMSFVNKDVIGLINDAARLLSLKQLGTIPFNGLRYVNGYTYIITSI